MCGDERKKRLKKKRGDEEGGETHQKGGNEEGINEDKNNLFVPKKEGRKEGVERRIGRRAYV